MPKTTKVKSKPSGKGLKKSFSLYSRKVQFFVIIIIVAVLGGGYMVYRSYAASGHWTYSLANGSLQIHRDARQVGEARKGNQTVVQMGPSAMIQVSVPGTIFPAIPAGQQMRFCLVSESPNPMVRVYQKDQSGHQFVMYGGANLNDPNSRSNFVSGEAENFGNGYYRACTPRRVFSKSLAGPIYIENKGQGNFKISEVNIRFIDGTTPQRGQKNW